MRSRTGAPVPARRAWAGVQGARVEEPFRGSEAVARGTVTPGRLRGPRFVRLFPDVYVSAVVPVTPLLRARAASIHAGPLDALAARRRDRPVFVAVRGTPAPEQRTLSRMTAPCPGFDPADLLVRRSLHPHVRGSARLDRVVALADPRAESPPETRLRLLLVLSGLPVPQVRFPLYDGRSRPWLRFDLAYPDALLAIEYDGAHHDDPLDRIRDTRTAALGWQTLRITADGLTRNAGRTVGTVRALLARRTRLAPYRPRPHPAASPMPRSPSIST
ncbi:endonuclease domain-containing protein [Pseudonocardia sp. TMWB2A]|uniref:endonuclease domain-containing protein n=1 Tax=Pseudonocardia sp. TMWB2A TaxID=687430 RepID=UPI00307E6803